ncbi:MAG TPA: ATP-binding protein [Gemmatimonas sp.]|nr:ATP-binding protein [Gemmatimonas sp.]
MRLTNRLLLTVLPIVALVMSALGGWFLFERERVLIPEVQQQTRAYARALDIAFEYGLRELDSTRVAALLDRTATDSRVAGIRLYDAQGRLQYSSASMTNAPAIPAPLLQRVLQGAPEVSLERSINDEDVFSVLRVIRDPVHRPARTDSRGGTVRTDSAADQGAVLGAVEFTQPYALLLASVRRLEIQLLIATIILLTTAAIAIAYMSRRTIAAPLEQLVAAARALGEGDIDARVPQSLGAAEPNALAREFNVMATRLAGARRELLRESEERVRIERRLAEAEKLATVGTLAAGLAHEIGAPLNVISGRAEMLLRQEQTSPAVARHLQSIVAQSGRITRTVRSLLDYARRPARRDDVVALDGVLDATLDLLDAECERAGVTVERAGSTEAWVRGDSDQLQQVVTNLLLNALQAMDGQPGEHAIRIEVLPCQSNSTEASGEVAIAVCDTGPGLSADLDGRLFTPFATTKPSGTGLGLVVARSIVQDHGGTLDGTTRTDGVRGACFTVRLPQVAAPPFANA